MVSLDTLEHSRKYQVLSFWSLLVYEQVAKAENYLSNFDPIRLKCQSLSYRGVVTKFVHLRRNFLTTYNDFCRPINMMCF